MAIAVFDYAAWSLRYPELKGAVSAELAALLFSEAGLYLDNSDCSQVQDVATRSILLNMLVAHLAALCGALEANGQPNGMVGRVSSASEGSVSVSLDTGLAAGTAAWFATTAYGFAFWQATKRYRMARYIPAQPYVSNPWRQPWPR